jgi:sugar O-acyltransferase (sialic acid O-acetyltransferase NeuD family)
VGVMTHLLDGFPHKPLLIFGIGQMAEVASFFFTEHTQREIVGYVADSEFISESSFLGKPILATEEIDKRFPSADHDLFIAVGYGQGNLPRSEKFSFFTRLGYNLPSYVSPKATVFSDLSIGQNCFILEDNTIQPFAKIGDNVVMWSGNHLGHHSRIGSHTFISSHVVISGNVSIGERCFVGVNATFRDGIEVGNDVTIGAGSLVMRNVEDNSLLIPPRTEPRFKAI